MEWLSAEIAFCRSKLWLTSVDELSLAAIALFWKQKLDFPGVDVSVLYAVRRSDTSVECCCGGHG